MCPADSEQGVQRVLSLLSAGILPRCASAGVAEAVRGSHLRVHCSEGDGDGA